MQRSGGCKLFVCMEGIDMSVASLHRESTNSLILHVHFTCNYVYTVYTKIFTFAMKLLSRKMLAGPASRVYWDLLVAEACRNE